MTKSNRMAEQVLQTTSKLSIINKRYFNLSFTFIVSALFVMYIFMYDPFCFVDVVRPSYRIGVEFFLLLIFLTLWVSKGQPGFIPADFLLIPIVLFWLLFSESKVAPGMVSKLFLLIFGVHSLQKHPSLTKFLARVWVLVWTLVFIHITLAAIGKYCDFITFPPLDESFSFFTTSSLHYFNLIFGYNFHRGFGLSQFTGFMVEPQFAGFMAGLNIIAAPYFLPINQAKKFRILSLIAGILSGSLSFIFFFISLGVLKVLTGKRFDQIRKRKSLILTFILVGGIISCIVLFWFGYAPNTSLSERVFRLSIGVNALKQINLNSLLFGNFYYGVTVHADRGIANGFLTVLVQRGLIPFSILTYLLFKYSRHNLLLTAYLFYTGMMVEYFWWPAFVFCLVLFYCRSSATQTTSHRMYSSDDKDLSSIRCAQGISSVI